MNVKRRAALIMRGKLKLWEKLYPEWFEALTKEWYIKIALFQQEQNSCWKAGGKMKNRGKEFEKVIKKNFEKIDGVDIERIKDSPNRYAGVANICDFKVFRKPCLHYIECKEYNGASLPLSKIREKQLNELPEKEKICGVTAGFIVWLQPKDRTFYVSATDLYKFFQTSGKKSFNPEKAGVKIFDIPAKKKRVYSDYELDKLLEYLEENNE